MPAKQRPGWQQQTCIAPGCRPAKSLGFKVPEHPGGYEVDQSVAGIRSASYQVFKVRWTPAQAQTW
jgi:hypothetical protein